jgi:hypothetical protein
LWALSIRHRFWPLCVHKTLTTSSSTNTETTQWSHYLWIVTKYYTASILKFIWVTKALEYCVSVWNWDVRTKYSYTITASDSPRPLSSIYIFEILRASAISEYDLDLNIRLPYPICDNLILDWCVKVHVVVGYSWYHHHSYS